MNSFANFAYNGFSFSSIIFFSVGSIASRSAFASSAALKTGGAFAPTGRGGGAIADFIFGGAPGPLPGGGGGGGPPGGGGTPPCFAPGGGGMPGNEGPFAGGGKTTWAGFAA